MKSRWQKKEIKDAKSFGGKRTIRSGGLWFCPGDVMNRDFLIDAKTTQHAGFTVTRAIWHKIRMEALNSQRMPCLSVQLGDGTEFVILDKNDFLSWFKEEK